MLENYVGHGQALASISSKTTLIFENNITTKLQRQYESYTTTELYSPSYCKLRFDQIIIVNLIYMN